MDALKANTDTSALLKKVRKIEIKTRSLTRELFSGDYQSAFKGQGISFSEVRAYQYGDDVRSIDWNVTARMGAPHLKIFEEERELTVVLLVDISPSVFSGWDQSPQEVMAELSAIFAFSAIQNNDKVGLLLFADQVYRFIPPGKGKRHILRIIREILYHRSTGKRTHIGEALAYLNRILHKRSVLFLMSDFFSAPFAKPLQLTSRRHDLIGIHLRNAVERNVPERGIYRLVDPESGKIVEVDFSDSQQLENWRAYFETHASEVEQQFKKNKSDLIPIFSNASYVKTLHQFFSQR